MKLSEIVKHQLDDTKCLYRLHNLINDYNYIGMAFNGLDVRLFGRYGYVNIYHWMRNNNYKIYRNSPDILLNINEAIFKYGLDNFELIKYDDIKSLNEEILISRYNSVLIGYNKTLDGLDSNETKYKTRYFTDGYSNARLPIRLSDEILKIEGIRLGMTHHAATEHGPIFNKIWITDGTRDKAIFETELMNYDLNIWKRGRSISMKGVGTGKKKSRSSIKGKISVITKEGKVRYIDPVDLVKYQELGYIKGGLSGSKGLRLINDGVKEMSVPKSELGKYLDSNWKLGHLPSFSSKMEGKVTVSNGVIEKRVDRSELPKYLELKFIVGGLKGKPATTSGKIYIHNEVENKLINPDELDEYLELGYKRGMKPRKK